MKQKLNDELSCIWDGRKKGNILTKNWKFFMSWDFLRFQSSTHTFRHSHVSTCRGHLYYTNNRIFNRCVYWLVHPHNTYTHTLTNQTQNVWHFSFSFHPSFHHNSLNVKSNNNKEWQYKQKKLYNTHTEIHSIQIFFHTEMEENQIHNQTKLI